MNAIAAPVRTAPRVSTRALLVVAGIAVAAIATTLVALGAYAAGVDASFAALQTQAYLPGTIVGSLVALAGWAIIRARANRPSRVLRVLVPVALVVSFVPDIALLVTGFIPGATATAVIALALMHVIVVAVNVPVLRCALPLAA